MNTSLSGRRDLQPRLLVLMRFVGGMSFHERIVDHYMFDRIYIPVWRDAVPPLVLPRPIGVGYRYKISH